MQDRLPCFKVYDVRGIVPTQLSAEIAFGVGRALADETGCKTCVIGNDIRLSSEEISRGLADGLRVAGVDVIDIGLCGTEMIYFATANYSYDAGVMITASHNPPEYNGMKIVREGSRPISGDSGLWAIERRVRESDFSRTGAGSYSKRDVYEDFVKHLVSVVPASSLKPLKVLANPGNGCAGLAVRALAPHIPLKVAELDFEPDGSFPKGVPNPILEESHVEMKQLMSTEKYDFGVAWDGDYDRCFFFDENADFVDGYYMVGLLVQDTLENHPGATIIHDPRCIWNTLAICERLGGRPVMCKTGHAFIKERMRAEDAIYGGEMSAHHYFKEHWFCDSGMIPFLMIARLISRSGRTLSGLVSEMMRNFPVSGEINSVVADASAAIARVRAAFAGGIEDNTDGVSIAFDNWRFNLRSSNTEPIVRLNVESRGDKELVDQKAQEILTILRA